MKTTTITTISLKSAAFVAACFAMSAQAGTTETAAAPSAGLLPLESLDMKATIGYDTRYYFRGLWFSNDNIATTLSYSKELCDKSSFNLVGYYTDSASNLNYSELDLGASYGYDAGFANFSFGYQWYYFFNGFFGNGFGQEWAHELYTSATVPLGPVNLTGLVAYDFAVDTFYGQLTLDTTFEVNSWLSIVPSVALGYSVDNYYTFNVADENDFTHVILNVAAPITLTESTTLTPYIAYNISLGAREDLNTIEGDDEFFAGAALSVSF